MLKSQVTKMKSKPDYFEIQVWIDGAKNKRSILKKITHKDNLEASKFELEKKLIIRIIKRYINHRNAIIHYYGGFKSDNRCKALSRLKAVASILPDQKPGGFYPKLDRMVKDLETIMPGRMSDYYEHDREIVDFLRSYAKAKLKNQDNGVLS